MGGDRFNAEAFVFSRPRSTSELRTPEPMKEFMTDMARFHRALDRFPHGHIQSSSRNALSWSPK